MNRVLKLTNGHYWNPSLHNSLDYNLDMGKHGTIDILNTRYQNNG